MAFPVAAALPLLGDILRRVLPDKEAQDRAAAEPARMVQDGELKSTELQLSAILAEAQSEDPWTSRARPTFLYVIYSLILLCFGAGIIGIWFPDHVTTAAQNFANLLGALPQELWWLFGTGYLGYTGARSFDKRREPRR